MALPVRWRLRYGQGTESEGTTMGNRGSGLAKIGERPREWLDDLDLKDLKDLPGDLRDRVGDPRDRIEELRDVVGNPRERVDELREVATETAETARERAEDLEPVLRQLAIQILTVFRALVGLLLIVPRLVVRGLGAVGDLLDRAEVAREKGYELSERARDVARSVPPSRRGRWKRRLLATTLFGAGFAIGFAIGWFTANRLQEDSFYEEPSGLQSRAEPLRPVPEDADAASDDEPGTGTGA